MKLTEHLCLEEFTRSSIASVRGINNSLNPNDPQHAEIIANLKNLCEQVLEPLRQFFDVPIVIGSGYRCPALNKAVGGAKNSQHMTGEAADIHIPLTNYNWSDGKPHTDKELGRKWMSWIIDNCPVDQCIWETTNRKDFWIHVSCKRDLSKNRGQVISFMLKT